MCKDTLRGLDEILGIILTNPMLTTKGYLSIMRLVEDCPDGITWNNIYESTNNVLQLELYCTENEQLSFQVAFYLKYMYVL